MYDISFSPLPIPERFHRVAYREDHYPGAPGLTGLEQGANCQHFAYELIRDFGCFIPDFRSSDLWEDSDHTFKVEKLEPLDLVMVHKTENAWGAHVGVHVGQDMIVHLSKKIGWPVVENLTHLMKRPEYQFYIGAKRCRQKVNR